MMKNFGKQNIKKQMPIFNWATFKNMFDQELSVMAGLVDHIFTYKFCKIRTYLIGEI